LGKCIFPFASTYFEAIEHEIFLPYFHCLFPAVNCFLSAFYLLHTDKDMAANYPVYGCYITNALWVGIKCEGFWGSGLFDLILDFPLMLLQFLHSVVGVPGLVIFLYPLYIVWL